ncbi:MAG: hypothetical protein QUU85_13440 [Candidatus Eisenbacteria bacterium]|nr:hypothetical protein [Candidatus Eisenbacteria bacterium]
MTGTVSRRGAVPAPSPLARLLPLLMLALSPSLLLVVPELALAQTIDFETLPNGEAPTEGMLIGDQYDVAPFGVRFELIGGDPATGPRIAAVGSPETAFEGPSTTSPCIGERSTEDMPASEDEGVGCFFLTDDGVNSPDTFGLRILYDTPVHQASGDLIDIQPCCESWRIRALGDSGEVLAEQVLSSGDPGTGDGVATPWQFDLGPSEIHSIELEYIGDHDHAVGLAFDNFSPSSLPTDAGEASWGKVRSSFR